MKSSSTRRQFLRLAASISVAAGARAGGTAAPPGTPTSPGTPASPGTAIGDGALRIELDADLHTRALRVRHGPRGNGEIALTEWAATEYLQLADGSRLDRFAFRDKQQRTVDGPHGRGTELTVAGASVPGVEKMVRITIFERYPGFAVLEASYRNASSQPIALRGWVNADVMLLAAAGDAAAAADAPQFWSYCGSTHEDRRDWVQPVRAGFAQDNFMGMNASDYGGGTPIVDVWRRDCGLAVGHLETTPRLVSLPVKHTARGVSLGISGPLRRLLEPGEQFDTPQCFIATHSGDHFATLDTYRRIMGDSGMRAASPPDAAYEAIWCAWGYERACTPQLIEDTLPKVRELGLKWAVIDDGWQSNVGDWNPHPQKFPGGAPDLERLVGKIRAASLKPRLWVAPLAAAPGSDLLHDHPDMLLLDKNGAPQLVSWWNSFYLCPAYAKTVDYTDSLVRRIIGEWGFAGLKIDGQHLNGVAPCYNPAHGHARPEESVEKLQDFFHAMYTTARRLDPEVVMELCPCGTAYSFFNFASMNQAPASDPESSWQVRLKGKSLKALMGPSAAFAGDHVELSDGHDDFASTVGIGAIVSTKFTWPRDPKPKDSFLLTPEKEALWRKWIALYNERLLPRGTYRGELYDIGFDKPETHVVEKSGRLYYALYARDWKGPVKLKGLAPGRYRVRDYFNDRNLGEIEAPAASLPLTFEHFLVLEAVPA
ncbi:MAG TPA: glycoside hydrolase family 36 protein [Steroidobacteraceae bacterium]|nr:glycoside hydrolase family 36 protein [Steroidobacteraceae bacterium]